ncbi:MAG: dihydrodipicolinate synthase family protein [Desulfarculus sp.]|nr:MAG: dihydrodipicolinate synthase family protein [Desulfarculus sp.]
MNKPLGGILPPIATPFKDEELDIAALKANIKAWNATGLAGYLVVGSNGEAVYLDDAEQEQAIAAVKEAAAPDKLVMAGTGRESTRATVQATRRAAAQGADCALVVTPHYFKGQMTPARLAGHFQRVADSSPIPILLYNVPQATGVNLGPEVVAELSRHANIAGVKDSSGTIAQLSEIIHLSREGFRVFVGNAEVLYPALCLGAVGGILAVANVLPSKCVELVSAFQAGDYERSRRLQWEIAQPAALVTRIHGVGGLKAAMDLAGFQGGAVRMPLTMPTPQVVQELEAAFRPLLP